MLVCPASRTRVGIARETVGAGWTAGGPCRIMTQAPGLALVMTAVRAVAASVRTLR
jgi:hypothetical protein